MSIETVGSLPLWLGFIAFVLIMLGIDLGIFHKKAHEVSAREALGWSLVWVMLAAIFGVGLWVWFGPERALEFATGYLIEKALAVDNIFVFVIIFSAFAVPAVHQHRILFWGVLGALLMRAVFIFAGAALLARFHFTMYIFGALLAITGVKLLLQREKEPSPERNIVVRALQKVIPVSHSPHDGKFMLREGGRRYATPLLLALLAVEVTDLIFALDSIPAIFAVTLDPFIVFTSNIFAILGLRSLYFLLASVIQRFRYLKVGLSLVLIFVGLKMLAVEVYKVPIALSLGIIAFILGGSIVFSLWRSPGGDHPEAAHGN